MKKNTQFQDFPDIYNKKDPIMIDIHNRDSELIKSYTFADTKIAFKNQN